MCDQSIDLNAVGISGIIGIAVGFSMWFALHSLPVGIAVAAGVSILFYSVVIPHLMAMRKDKE